MIFKFMHNFSFNLLISEETGFLFRWLAVVVMVVCSSSSWCSSRTSSWQGDLFFEVFFSFFPDFNPSNRVCVFGCVSEICILFTFDAFGRSVAKNYSYQLPIIWSCIFYSFFWLFFPSILFAIILPYLRVR